jgi:glutamate dehydrogenase
MALFGKSSNDKNTLASGKLLQQMIEAIAASTLPGENEGFAKAQQKEAASFMLQAADKRKVGEAAIAVESFTNAKGKLATRIAINNDDTPFLVDSVSSALAACGYEIDRLVHPIAHVVRGMQSVLVSLGERDNAASRKESFIYLELSRLPAIKRVELAKILHSVLTDVRAAVNDWQQMLTAMDDDAARLKDEESIALINWFIAGNMTVLAHEHIAVDGIRSDRLGLARSSDEPLLSDTSRIMAIKWFEDGNKPPLILKSNRLSTVHRHVQLDLLLVPIIEDGKATAFTLTAGLWTSAALATAPDRIPVLRKHLPTLMQRFGFDSEGHAGKAMVHVLTNLPHDLLVALNVKELERVTLIAMSLTDRPRPKLMLVRSPLGGHIYVFVWLPRDDVSAELRGAIEAMLLSHTNGHIMGWSISLEDSGLALLRYTLDLANRNIKLSEDDLDNRLSLMVRGWEPAVEAGLSKHMDAKRSAAAISRYGAAFPIGYRTHYTIDEAVEDSLSLLAMERDQSRIVKLRKGKDENALWLKVFSHGGAMPLSDIVPVIENFGFKVLEEMPTPLGGEVSAYIHDFRLAVPEGQDVASIIKRTETIDSALSAVLDGKAENDAFNSLIAVAGLDPVAVLWLRAGYRYMRQVGRSYSILNVVAALSRNAGVSKLLVQLFTLAHEISLQPGKSKDGASKDQIRLTKGIDSGIAEISIIDDDRILRFYRAFFGATLRTNAFAPSAKEALVFKLDSAKIPGLPAPLPWREIFVYSPRVEGIHLRTGAVARGGLRWSDRRDDFRTEILGLMKAQRVKNAVIVPTGAKGGFYPKRLPDPGVNRDAWLAEGNECYKIFIRSLLSVTDNIVLNKVIHPAGVKVLDGDDPYFVVAADKGTAAFSDVANAIALERNFWLGDAFASGGSNGYDHKAMGITAKGAWISVQRHFAEIGVDIQKDAVTVAGVGDMSGDVFGNGMLLSKSIKLVAAFDHRHIFIDPDPDPVESWNERDRLFKLPRSSWADYDAKLISKGGGVFSRAEKSIKLTREVQDLLGLTIADLEPAELMKAILRCDAQLMWFGGIGTYIKDDAQNHVEVGDPANDALRINATEVRAKVIGEGANLGVTQAGRIGFALRGGRINTDFIDNSAGVDCSDNEVNIKIVLNAEMVGGKLSLPVRNKLLAQMTDEVAHLVLEDNRLQTLALSIAEKGGSDDLSAYLRLIENFEAAGKLDRKVEGLASNEQIQRRLPEGNHLTRPELSVLLATAKLAMQDGVEASSLGSDHYMESELFAAFPRAIVSKHKTSILSHRLRNQIIATKVANRMINRMGMLYPFELAEEECCPLSDVAEAFVIAESLFDLPTLWTQIDKEPMAEDACLHLFAQLAVELRAVMADIIRNGKTGRTAGEAIKSYAPSITRLSGLRSELLPAEVKAQTGSFGARLMAAGVPKKLAEAVQRLAELDGAIGLSAISNDMKIDVKQMTIAFTRLGGALALSWAQGVAMQLDPVDPWERLLAAGVSRDFQAIRLEFLRRIGGKDPVEATENWLSANINKVATFRAMVERARVGAAPTPAMLAQLAGQARILLGR